MNIYWNILTVHLPINVKSPNNISEWQMGFNSAFKGLILIILILIILSMEGSSCSGTAGAVESVGVNGSDRVWSAGHHRKSYYRVRHSYGGWKSACSLN